MAPTPGKSVIEDCRGIVSSAFRESGTMIRGIGFWTGIVLPLLYLPLLLLNHSIVADMATFSKLIALHVTALFVGKGHAGSVDDE